MAKFLPLPARFQFIDEDGLPAIDYKLYTYAAGTTTPLATYTDSTGATANANPIILDAYGSAAVWISSSAYKFVLKDPDDVTIWTTDNIDWSAFYADNITWTGNHTFDGTVEFNGNIISTTNFTGAMTVDDTLYVTGALTVDGAASFNGDIASDSVTTPLVTLDTGETLSSTAGVITLGGNLNVKIISDVGGTPRTFDFREDGQLRLPVTPPVDANDAASKDYVDDSVAAAAPDGMVAVAIGAVVSNALVSGSVGVTSVGHPGSGEYTITLNSATTSTGKTIVFTTIRTPSPLRNYSAFPTVDTTTQITVKTGGGNTWTQDDRDFNFVVYSLP